MNDKYDIVVIFPHFKYLVFGKYDYFIINRGNIS